MTAYLLPNKDNSLSILLLGTQVAVGGAQRVLLNQGDWFHNRGHRVVAAFFYDKMGLSHEWQRESLFPIYNLDAYESGGNHFRQFFKLAGGLWRYWKLLRKQRFD